MKETENIKIISKEKIKRFQNELNNLLEQMAAKVEGLSKIESIRYVASDIAYLSSKFSEILDEYNDYLEEIGEELDYDMYIEERDKILSNLGGKVGEMIEIYFEEQLADILDSLYTYFDTEQVDIIAEGLEDNVSWLKSVL